MGSKTLNDIEEMAFRAAKNDRLSMQGESLVGISKVAEMLDIHPNTVRNHVRDGTLLPPFRKPGSHHWCWLKSDILNIIYEAAENRLVEMVDEQ